MQHETEDRRQRQQQREDGEDRVVGDQGGEVARSVLTELLEDCERERQPRTTLLRAVEPSQQRSHGSGLPTETRHHPLSCGGGGGWLSGPGRPPDPKTKSRWGR